ncbi:ferredoxin [Embleya scabrispora]|uniref:Ferredoxin n=1 Tax=Embleya scabrispora TaxID=159449 RepID=A0A1T3NJW8_9ACTN|nr:ferredoxin [Embleya scabrispora]OPC77147.1 ferredoxin [Embleya scabrispora]
MRITVDVKLCESHGQCVFAVPDVFAFDDDDCLIYESEPADVFADTVRAAVHLCPARAISTTAEPS